MPRDLLPLLEGVDHQRVGTRHHESQPGGALRHGDPRRGVSGLPLADEGLVGRGDGHVEGDLVTGKPFPDTLGIEGRLELADSARPKGARHGVDDAVDVVQRQGVEYTVAGRPAPGVDEGSNLGLDVGVSRYDSLGPPCRPACVEDHGGPFGGDLGQAVSCGAFVEQLRGQDETEPPRLRDRPQPIGELGVRDDHGCIGIVNRVLELGIGVRHRKRDGHAARTPDAPLRGHVLEAGRCKEGDSRPGQIGGAREQRRRRAGRGIQQGAVRVFPGVVDNRGAVSMDRCASE